MMMAQCKTHVLVIQQVDIYIYIMITPKRMMFFLIAQDYQNGIGLLTELSSSKDLAGASVYILCRVPFINRPFPRRHITWESKSFSSTIKSSRSDHTSAG